VSGFSIQLVSKDPGGRDVRSNRLNVASEGTMWHQVKGRRGLGYEVRSSQNSRRGWSIKDHRKNVVVSHATGIQWGFRISAVACMRMGYSGGIKTEACYRLRGGGDGIGRRGGRLG